MKRTKYPIHPDFKAWTNLNPPLNRTMLPMMQKLMGLLFDWEKPTKDLAVERKIIPVGDGASIRALWYVPTDVGENAPCLVYYHGGGFALPAAVCLMAQERGATMPCGQMLIYAATGAGRETQSMKSIRIRSYATAMTSRNM